MSESNVDLVKLREPFPQEAIKTRKGGGGMKLSFVDGTTVIRRLNDACQMWDFEVIREWQEDRLRKALVSLTIPGLGTRQHIGVQVVENRLGAEDTETKGAVTDGLKKAASLFGVALELYGPDYSSAAAVEAAGTATPTTRPVQSERSDAPKNYANMAGKKASPNQIKFLSSLLVEKLGAMKGEPQNALALEKFGKPATALDMAEVSQWIDDLKDMAPRVEEPADVPF